MVYSHYIKNIKLTDQNGQFKIVSNLLFFICTDETLVNKKDESILFPIMIAIF